MKQTLLRIFTGVILLLIGAGALLGALNIIPFWTIFGGLWPILIIVAGLIVIAGDIRRNAVWGIAMIVIGGLLLLKSQGILDFNFFALLAPIVIIAIGLSVLLNVKNRRPSTAASKDSDDIVAILSGADQKNVSKNYQGGKVTTIFGGAVLDLRDAKLKDTASLDLFVLFGGVELRVPRDWKVVSKVIPIAGGVENKSEGADDHKGPVLILTGTASFGGIEIKT